MFMSEESEEEVYGETGSVGLVEGSIGEERYNLSICTQHAAPRKSGLAVWVTTVAPRGVSSRSASGQLLQTEWGTRGSALCGAVRRRGENGAAAPPRARLS